MCSLRPWLVLFIVLLTHRAVLAQGKGFNAARAFPTQRNPFSPVVADFNGAGRLDVLVAINADVFARVGAGATLLLGNGDGTFQPAAGGVGLVQDGLSMQVADLNGDGKLD